MARGRLRRWADPTRIDAQEMREHFADDARECIGDLADRSLVSLCGSVRTVTLRPRGGVAALDVELVDGTGVVTLVFLGRRRIAGITPGRAMRVFGRIGVHDRLRVIYNPRYELIA